ncbi:PREDICTED: uncharacterized protein C9orf57 homolog [Dipodomys ordii]|uniref:Uncharacterized protein C9orf57 homolog n=1 Tax=Dipodomys ordii TaxID=10020 RepID=A0A1S3FC66_DIPOR|nr:PREDICTED: uncharacterized protein C9orf57 homolog [Dipodomys ordii]
MTRHMVQPPFGCKLTMRKTVFAGVFIFSCLLGDVRGVICRLCNLSIPFHGCLLDFGTCRTKPGQFCKVEAHTKGGIQWYTTKGCTESISECFKLQLRRQVLFSTHCCHFPLCNF